MSNVTSELNLKTAVDADDTADYLTLDLASSLQTLDGLFNATTGHTHNGSHQGGALDVQNLLIKGNLTVNGTTHLVGATTLDFTLSVTGATTLTTLQATATTLTTLHATGAVTLDSTLSVTGGVSLSATLLSVMTLPAISNAAYSDGNIQLQGLSNTAPRIGFHQVGVTAVALYKELGTENLRLRGASGVDALVITDVGTATLTNKTLTSPTLNAPTIGNATISNPTISGTVSGTATWSGAQALASGSTVGGDPIAHAPNSALNTIVGGAITALNLANDATVDVAVTFGFPFANTPFVIISESFSSNLAQQNNWAASARSVTSTGFTAQVLNRTGAQNSFFPTWIAIGQRA